MRALKSEAAVTAPARERIACSAELARARLELGVSRGSALEALG